MDANRFPLFRGSGHKNVRGIHEVDDLGALDFG